MEDDDLIVGKPSPTSKIYKLSDNQYEALKLASQKIMIPQHMFKSIPADPTQRVNLAWALIGKELGFKWWTAKRIPGKNLEIWAEPT